MDNNLFKNHRPPRYLEAYPRLDMVRAKAATEKELEVCEFVDHIGRVHGLAQFGDMTDEHIVFEYEITLPYLPSVYSSIRLKKISSPNGVDENRIITQCPKCQKRKAVLVYFGSWACSYCHGLMYRSQTMTYHTRLFERKKHLLKIVEGGRAKGMHHVTFVKLRKELAALSKDLKGFIDHSPNDQQNLVIQPRWKSRTSNHSLFFAGEMSFDNY